MRRSLIFVTVLTALSLAAGCGDPIVEDTTTSTTTTTLSMQPSISISTPVDGYESISMMLHVAGSAAVIAPYSITNVVYNLNGSGWESATGLTNWTIDEVMDEYTNEIVIRAYSDSGMYTETAMLTSFCSFPYGTVVFVSESGDDTNDGMTPGTPEATLLEAVTSAASAGISQVLAHGDYVYSTPTLNSGLYMEYFSDVELFGGWNADFTGTGGLSVIDGNSLCKHVVYINYCTNISFSNFIVRGGYSTDSYGGGIYINNSSHIEIYCTISNNSAMNGGGLYAYQSSYIYLDSLIVSNIANLGNGGGARFDNSKNCTIAGSIVRNYAKNGGAGIAFYYCKDFNVEGDISYNLAPNGGGGVFATRVTNFTVTATVSYNMATNGGDGGGLYFDFTFFSDIAPTCIGNDNRGPEFWAGGGLCMRYSHLNTISGTYISNRSSSLGGGIFFGASYTNYIESGTIIQYNHCGSSSQGGGVFVQAGLTNVIRSGVVYSPNFQGDGTTITNNTGGLVRFE